MNSPLYNLTHMHAMSPLNQNKNSVGSNAANPYTCNTPFGLKTVDSGNCSGQATSLGNSGVGGSEGPPTPTQELDISGISADQRKCKYLLHIILHFHIQLRKSYVACFFQWKEHLQHH